MIVQTNIQHMIFAVICFHLSLYLAICNSQSRFSETDTCLQVRAVITRGIVRIAAMLNKNDTIVMIAKFLQVLLIQLDESLQHN